MFKKTALFLASIVLCFNCSIPVLAEQTKTGTAVSISSLQEIGGGGTLDTTAVGDAAIRQQIINMYPVISAQYYGTFKRYFNGWCGDYVKYAATYLGTYNGRSYNGNQWYGNLSEGLNNLGYYQKKYPGSNALQDVVNAFHGQPVYNIIMGFPKQNGYDDSGRAYTLSYPGAGHVCYIHAVINGNVYYSESFGGIFGTSNEGQLIVTSLNTFVSTYNSYFGPAQGAIHLVGTPEAKVLRTDQTSGNEKTVFNFSWDTAANANYYDVIIKDTNGDTSQSIWGVTGLSTSKTLKPGTYSVFLRSCDNTHSGDVRFTGTDSQAVTITVKASDEVKPVISGVHINSVTADSIVVQCNATDNIGVTAVNAVPYTVNNPLTSASAVKTTQKSGNTYSVKVLTSDYSKFQGEYNIQLTAYDAAGNSTVSNIYGIPVGSGGSVGSGWSVVTPSSSETSYYQSKTQYAPLGYEVTTSSSPTLAGWTRYDQKTVYGDWSAVQTTSNTVTAGDTVQITGTTTKYKYHHYINAYDGYNNNIDSIKYGTNLGYDECELTYQLSPVTFQDQGGQQAYQGYTSPKDGFNYWFYDGTVTYTSYQTRTKATTYYFQRGTKDATWSDTKSANSVRTRTVYKLTSAGRNAKISSFVTTLYSTTLDRKPDDSGLNYWVNELSSGKKTGSQVVHYFVFGPEFTAKNYCNEHFLTHLYKAIFSRDADADGLKYWEDLMTKGKTREEVLNGFLGGTEFKTLCSKADITVGSMPALPKYGTIQTGACPNDNKIDNKICSFVLRMYTKCLGRSAEKAGLTYWTNQLNMGKVDGTAVAKQFFLSSEFTVQKTSNTEYVTRLYRTIFGREPETDGLNYWVTALKNGTSRESVLEGFAIGSEWTSICKSYGISK